MSERGTQKLMGIHWRVMNADFIVQMRPGATAGKAYVGDNLSAAHGLSVGYRKARQMTVTR